MSPMRKFRKWRQTMDKIEVYRAEAYAKGCDETAGKFIEQQQRLTEKIQKLSDRHASEENRMRIASDKRIADVEAIHEIKCTECRSNMEEERQRLRRRQAMLADKMARVDELIIKLLQHANVIVDEHDAILRSSGRIVSHRNVLIAFKKEVGGIMEEAAPLLSLELTDTQSNKAVDIDEITETKSRRDSKRDS